MKKLLFIYCLLCLFHSSKGHAQALEQAISSEDASAVERLLKSGANPNDLIRGYPPLFFTHSIKETPNSDLISDLLIQYGANINLPSLNAGQNSFQNCIYSSGPIRLVYPYFGLVLQSCFPKYLKLGPNFKYEDSNGYTPLLYAAGGSIAPLRYFIENKIYTVNAVNSKGVTALHVAADPMGFFFARKNILTSFSYEQVRFLLENGANPNIQDQDGRTPLMIAASFPGMFMNQCDVNAEQDYKVILLLIKSGARKDIKDKKGMMAYQFVRGNSKNCLADFLMP